MLNRSKNIITILGFAFLYLLITLAIVLPIFITGYDLTVSQAFAYTMLIFTEVILMSFNGFGVYIWLLLLAIIMAYIIYTPKDEITNPLAEETSKEEISKVETSEVEEDKVEVPKEVKTSEKEETPKAKEEPTITNEEVREYLKHLDERLLRFETTLDEQKSLTYTSDEDIENIGK